MSRKSRERFRRRLEARMTPEQLARRDFEMARSALRRAKAEAADDGMWPMRPATKARADRELVKATERYERARAALDALKRRSR
jgi:hypothetical protein